VSWPHGDPNAVVARVLRDPIYRHAAPTTNEKPQESLLEFVLSWLWDHLVKPLFHPIAHAFQATRGVGTVIGIVLVAAALLGLAFVVFRLVVAFARGPVKRRRARAAPHPIDDPSSARDWRALARAAAARGEFARAVAALFGAALAELDERAIVAFDASRTPGEYRRLVRRARASAASPFDELTERFSRALYAADPTVSAEYEAAERALAELEPALRA
jgi:hypothetical protein